MPKNLLAFVDSPADFSFCLRLRHGLHAKGFRLVVVTPKPSLIVGSYLRSLPCLLVKNSSNSTADVHVHSTTEVLSKVIGEKDAARYYNGVMEILERQHKVEGISVMFIRNGNSVPTKAMSIFAQTYAVATLYYEPSNIQGRLFVDPRGVDAQSLLFQKPEILNRFPVDDPSYHQWRESYLQRRARERSNTLDSAPDRDGGLPALIDHAGSLFFDLPVLKRTGVRRSSAGEVRADAYDADAGTFNFFPMQSSSDSRLMFNSSVSLEDALSLAYEKSREQRRDLLIQPHPGETKKEVKEYLASLKGKEGVYIVNGSSYRFVERCTELITVNSILAADALLAGKKVTFLGATFYAQMNDDRLKKFLLGYLLDIDYYAKENIPAKQVEAMLSRLLLQ